MKRLLLKWTNGLLFLVFFIQAATGIWLLLGDLLRKEPPEAIAEIHIWNGVLMVALILLHLILNWAWVRNNFFKHSTVTSS